MGSNRKGKVVKEKRRKTGGRATRNTRRKNKDKTEGDGGSIWKRRPDEGMFPGPFTSKGTNANIHELIGEGDQSTFNGSFL